MVPKQTHRTTFPFLPLLEIPPRRSLWQRIMDRLRAIRNQLEQEQILERQYRALSRIPERGVLATFRSAPLLGRALSPELILECNELTDEDLEELGRPSPMPEKLTIKTPNDTIEKKTPRHSPTF